MPPRKSLTYLYFCLCLMAAMLFSACGGGSSHTSTNLSATQVQAITTEMQTGFSSAIGTATAGPCTGGNSNQFCFNVTANCSGGGTVSASGQFTESVDVNNTGQISGNMTLIPANCSVRNSNLVVNGDPNLNFATTMNVLNGELTSLRATETGAISYGPDPSGVCEYNVTVTATITPTQTCRVTGTACGRSLDYTCQ